MALASHDIAVYDRSTPVKYAPGAKFEFEGVIPEFLPMEFAALASRNWIVRVNREADYNISANDITVKFLKDCNVDRIAVTGASWPNFENEFDHWYFKPGAGAPVQSRVLNMGDKIDEQRKMSPGGYVYEAPVLGGNPVLVLLDAPEPLTVYTVARPYVSERERGFRSNNFVFAFPNGRRFKVGEEFTYRILMATRISDDQSRSNQWIEQVLTDYGIGRTPGYTYQVDLGKLLKINYFMDIQAEDGGAILKIGKYPLVNPLPVRVNALAPQSVTGEYNLKTRRVRLLPNFENSVVATVDPRREQQDFYYGELLRYDNPMAVVDMVPENKDFKVEIHNPTARALPVTITGAPHFAPLAGTEKTFTVPAHQSIIVVLQSRPGTVELAPIK